MSNSKVETVWLFQKYDGRSFFASGVMEILHVRDNPMTCIYLEKRSNAQNPLENFGCRVVYLGRSGATKIFNPFLLWELVKFLKENKADILHCHRHKATFYGSLAAELAKTPLVFSHVHGLRRTRTFLRKLENRILHRLLTKVITVSDAVRDNVIESNPHLPLSKVITIRNSVDFKKFSGVSIDRQQERKTMDLPGDAFVFGTVGRLAPTKGQSYLIEAFAKVRQVVPNSLLVFVGSGRLEADLKQLAADRGCLDGVRFLGQRSDVPQVLRAFDCFVLPSLAEGFPGSLLEAMASALPCIASAVGGITEIIDDDKRGYLVPPKDSNALANAMISCFSMTEQARSKMGGIAQEAVKILYSHDVYAEKLTKLYYEEYLQYVR